MRIGLASDTHGNVDPLERALDLFSRAQVDRVFFLGGRLADLDAALARRRRPARAAASGGDSEFLAAVEGALARHAGVRPDALDGKIARVASRACAEYARPDARKQVDLVDGRICCLVHDKAELTRDDIENATLFFHGNSESPGLVQIGARFFVTPGHLRAAAAPGRPATFAMLEATAKDLVLTVYSPECAEIGEQRASLAGPGGKMSVRG